MITFNGDGGASHHFLGNSICHVDRPDRLCLFTNDMVQSDWRYATVDILCSSIPDVCVTTISNILDQCYQNLLGVKRYDLLHERDVFL